MPMLEGGVDIDSVKALPLQTGLAEARVLPGLGVPAQEAGVNK